MEVAIRGNNLSAPTKSVSPSNTGYNRDNQYQVMTSDLVMVAVMVILAENVSQKSHKGKVQKKKKNETCFSLGGPPHPPKIKLLFFWLLPPFFNFFLPS